MNFSNIKSGNPVADPQSMKPIDEKPDIKGYLIDPATLEKLLELLAKVLQKLEEQTVEEFWDFKKIREKTTLAAQTVRDRIDLDPEFPKGHVWSQNKVVFPAAKICDYIRKHRATISKLEPPANDCPTKKSPKGNSDRKTAE